MLFFLFFLLGFLFFKFLLRECLELGGVFCVVVVCFVVVVLFRTGGGGLMLLEFICNNLELFLRIRILNRLVD